MALSPTISSAPQFAAKNAEATIQRGNERLAFKKSFASERRRRENQPIRMVAMRYSGRIAMPKVLRIGVDLASNLIHTILTAHDLVSFQIVHKFRMNLVQPLISVRRWRSCPACTRRASKTLEPQIYVRIPKGS